MLKGLSAYLKTFSNFFVPPFCINCEQEIDSGILCGHCYDAVVMATPPFCKHCGRPSGKNEVCRYCKKNDPSLDRVRAWSLFIPPMDKIIHAFKYGNKSSLATILGRSMAKVMAGDPVLMSYEYLVPVPLFSGRERDRGYNQSELLCREISIETGKKILNCLLRTRNTPTQTTLKDEKRRVNVAGAFKMRQGVSVVDKILLLVDDVMTTGATLDECAEVLKAAGAKNVYGLICAVAPGRQKNAK